MKTHNPAALLLAVVLLAGCEDKAPAPAGKPAQNPPPPVSKSGGPAPMVNPPTSGAPGSGSPMVNPPMPGPAAQPAAMTPGEVHLAGLSFKVPEGWKQVQPSGGFRLAELQLPDPSGDPAKTCTTAFSIAGGDPKANISRWAGQVTDASGYPGTPQVSERTVEGVKVTIVELTGSYTNTMGNEPKRDNWMMRAAIIEGLPDPAAQGEALFIKMTGPADRMAGAGQAFNAMIDGLKKQ
jgi:hypothetical protein